MHGGWIAFAFDEVLGIANIAAGNPGMTARLTVHYRRPTPLFRELRLQAWVDRVEGRRIMSRAEMYDGDTLTAEAEGLFVQPRPELAEQYFGADEPLPRAPTPRPGSRRDARSPGPRGAAAAREPAAESAPRRLKVGRSAPMIRTGK